MRLGLWLRRARQPIDETRIAAKLRLTVVLAGALAVGFMAWCCTLFAYGDADARAHMLFYVAPPRSPACSAWGRCGRPPSW